MRWNHLSIDEDSESAARPLIERRAVSRTFDTPEFRGITFYEIHARSIINKVPAASHVPFRWTINPYRGCSHACTYCLSGETPILMADGRTKLLADVKAGDRIYGTVREGAYRRYATTEVLAHWQTVKPAYRVTLADGTELIASGDHRFLTDRGWKHVTGSEHGRDRRPFLTANNKLMGVGRLAEPPKETADYRRGYLCGMIRGDAHLGSYSYPHGRIHQFRLALADREALQRSRGYLRDFGVETTEFEFTSSESITGLIEWPAELSDDWCKGFLAGIFDAEGSCSRGVLRISNSDPLILHHIGLALRRLGFEPAVDVPGEEKSAAMARFIGGLRERLRFFLTTDPAITRKRSIEGTAIKGDARLDVVSIEPLGLDLPMYDITTGTGDFIANGVVSHNCFARRTHEYLDLDSGADFDSRIVVKMNAGDLLRRELGRPSWSGEHIAMGTNVDCYQRAEGRYELMPEIIAALRDAANPFSILTKGSLILRDIPLLQEAAEVTDVSTAVSIGFVDDQIRRAVEPGTPNPQKRLEVCAQLNDHGIGCAVLMAPILPYLTDSMSQLEATVSRIAETGATGITPIVLHLRPGAREWYLSWLEREHPRLVPRYKELYGRGAYAPKAYQDRITEQVGRLAKAYRVGEAARGRFRRIRPRPGPAAPPRPEHTQLALL